jgi:hypothetical protein
MLFRMYNIVYAVLFPNPKEVMLLCVVGSTDTASPPYCPSVKHDVTHRGPFFFFGSVRVSHAKRPKSPDERYVLFCVL